MLFHKRVKVTSCHLGWTDRFLDREGAVVTDGGSDTVGVLLDGLIGELVFFRDELTIIEEATT